MDPYNEMIPRLLESLQVPAKALIGPWTHGYPQPAAPGPGLEWAFEEVRWWRHWLSGEANGVMDGPRVWAFLAEQSPIEAAPGPMTGRWVAERAWPRGAPMELSLAPGRLTTEVASGGLLEIDGARLVGLQTPEWVPFSLPQYPQEQSCDDAQALVFDGEPLDAPLDILGAPTLRVRVAASRSVATLVARLTEVTPDGRSWLVSYGVLNLTHRNGHAAPEPLVPGEFYDVETPLYLAGRRLRQGARIRLALSQGLWPLLWPAPAPADLTIDLAGSSLWLPVRPSTEREPDFPIPILTPSPGARRGDPEILRHVDGEAQFDDLSPPSQGVIAETGTTIERSGGRVEARMKPGDPNSCRWRDWQDVRYVRGDWDCRIAVEVEVTSTADDFLVVEGLKAWRGETQVFEREHRTTIPRDLM